MEHTVRKTAAFRSTAVIHQPVSHFTNYDHLRLLFQPTLGFLIPSYAYILTTGLHWLTDWIEPCCAMEGVGAFL